MPEYVRVKDSSGHEITVRADVAEGHPRGVLPGMTVLKSKEAVDRNGTPRGPIYRVPKGSDPAPSATTGTSKKSTNVPKDPSGEDGRPAGTVKES